MMFQEGPGETGLESPFHLKRKFQSFYSQDSDKVVELRSYVISLIHMEWTYSELNTKVLIIESGHNVKREKQLILEQVSITIY